MERSSSNAAGFTARTTRCRLACSTSLPGAARPGAGEPAARDAAQVLRAARLGHARPPERRTWPGWGFEAMLHHVILGAGPAGVIAAETLRQHAPLDRITLVGDEPEPPLLAQAAIPIC